MATEFLKYEGYFNAVVRYRTADGKPFKKYFKYISSFKVDSNEGLLIIRGPESSGHAVVFPMSVVISFETYPVREGYDEYDNKLVYEVYSESAVMSFERYARDETEKATIWRK